MVLCLVLSLSEVLNFEFSYPLAGGLAVFLHADFAGTLIVDSAKYRAFPDAG